MKREWATAVLLCLYSYTGNLVFWIQFLFQGQLTGKYSPQNKTKPNTQGITKILRKGCQISWPCTEEQGKAHMLMQGPYAGSQDRWGSLTPIQVTKVLSRKDQDLRSETLRKSPQVKKIFWLKALLSEQSKGKGNENGKGRGRWRGKKVYLV